MGERSDTTMSGGGRSSEQIRNDIRRTRGEMGTTIDELQYRMSPDYIRYRVKEVSMDKGRGIMGRVKENPLPAAMVGLGLAMLFRPQDHREEHEKFVVDVDAPTAYPVYTETAYATYEDNDRGMTDRARERMHDAGDSARDAAHRAQDRMHDAADSVRGTAHDAADNVRDSAHRAREAASRSMHRAGMKARELGTRTRYGARRAGYQARDTFMDHPLVLGAVGVAIGALLGAVIPETDREDELMGEASERVRREAARRARETGEQARHVAEAAAGAAKEHAREAVRDTKQHAKEALRDSKEAARETARREGLTGDGRDTTTNRSSMGSTSVGSTGLGSTTTETGSGSATGSTGSISDEDRNRPI